MRVRKATEMAPDSGPGVGDKAPTATRKKARMLGIKRKLLLAA